MNVLFASDAADAQGSLFDGEKEQTDLLKANVFRSSDVSDVSREQIRVLNYSTHNPATTTSAQGDTRDFDFRKWLSQFTFSDEAKALHNAALQIFRYYHASPQYAGKDWNDSFYDITNAIMGKDASSFRDFESEGRGFSRLTIHIFICILSLYHIERKKIFLHRENTARHFDRAFYDASKRNQNFWGRLLVPRKKTL